MQSAGMRIPHGPPDSAALAYVAENSSAGTSTLYRCAITSRHRSPFCGVLPKS